MKNRKDKKFSNYLEDSAKQQGANFNRTAAAAEAPNPLAQELQDSNLRFLRQTSGKEGPLDINTVEGMSPYLALYDNAVNAREEDRAGTGLAQLGSRGANPTFMGLLKEQMANRRQERAAGQLSNAFAMRNAEVKNSVLPLASLDQNRRLSVAGMYGNQYGNLLGLRAGFRPGPSLFAQLLDQAQQGAATAAQFAAAG